jgi:hypothetical protein
MDNKWLYLIWAVLIVVVVGAVWYIVGGAAMGVLFGALVAALGYMLGRFHEQTAMKNGAELALRAQESDDKRDIKQLDALKQFLAYQQQIERNNGRLPAAQYPALSLPAEPTTKPSRSQQSPYSFIIDGLEDGEADQ